MEPVDLFYSYAHEDEPLRDELAGHLKIMERRGVIRGWHDRGITAGADWDQTIDEHLATADLVLLLISADFINSDYIWGHELDVAMKRHESGEAAVVPVMLRAVDIEGAPFASIQGLPTDLRPVTSWPNRDEAWTDVAKGIRRTVENIRARTQVVESNGPSAPRASVFAGQEYLARLRKPAVPAPAGHVGGPSSTDDFLQGLTADPLLAKVVDEFAAQVVRAAKARGQTLTPAAAARHARAIIDAPDQKRVLWVDDRPTNNHFEAAALVKLQVEVLSVQSTGEALARIDKDPEPFDLVISDWQRPEADASPEGAGIHLLRELRKRQPSLPVVFYHGSFRPEQRRALRALAMAEGAAGEAVLPDELLALVAEALGLA